MPSIKTISRTWLPPKEESRGNDPFYQSKAWKKVRRLFAELNPLCAECKKQGIITEMEVVDHVIPIKQGGAPLSFSNLQSLSTHHHAIKSAKERS